MRSKPLFAVKFIYLLHNGVHCYAESFLEAEFGCLDIDALDFKRHLSQMQVVILQVQLLIWLKNCAYHISLASNAMIEEKVVETEEARRYPWRRTRPQKSHQRGNQN